MGVSAFCVGCNRKMEEENECNAHADSDGDSVSENSGEPVEVCLWETCTERNEMNKKTVWSDKYRGVNFEIQNFKIGGIEKDCWTFYLFIMLDSLPESVRERFWLPRTPSDIIKSTAYYRYSSEPLMAGLDWHCEITWYSKEAGFDGEKRCVKIGCDYQHYWDEDRSYDVGRVETEAHRCIDSLYEMIPDLMVWCQGCGVFYKPTEGVTVCPACIEKRKQGAR